MLRVLLLRQREVSADAGDAPRRLIAQRDAAKKHSPARHLAAAGKELLATRRGEEESESAEATTPAHYVIWFDKKDDGLISGIQKPSADGAASLSPHDWGVRIPA